MVTKIALGIINLIKINDYTLTPEAPLEPIKVLQEFHSNLSCIRY
jgi:hypothetical protein